MNTSAVQQEWMIAATKENHYYRTNVNLEVEPWLHYFIVTSATINLSLAAFTFVFQITHPRSRRNMGRFFLIILALQSTDKINALLQELYIKDLSLPYYEIDYNVINKSMETKVCQFMGFITTFFDYMSQFYALWFAVLIKMIIKDPIHKLQKMILFFHIITFILSATLTGILSHFNTFGVQEDLQCGIMYTPGLDDEVLMIVPFVLVPVQMYCISTITKQTPFIVRQSLKRFVSKYTLYVALLMSMQCMQVAIVVFGSREPMFFDYDIPDGFKALRIGYVLLDHFSFACLIGCTLYEPIFIKKCEIAFNLVKNCFIKQQQIPLVALNGQKKKDFLLIKTTQSKRGGGSDGFNTVGNCGGPDGVAGSREHDEGIRSMDFESNQINLENKHSVGSEEEEEENFEQGDNQMIEMRSELDMIDGQKFEDLVSDFNDKFIHMSIKQKTSYFIINTVLMSICHCLIHANDQEVDRKTQSLKAGFLTAVRSLTYQLTDNNDIYHIMDVAAFYKQHPGLCVTDLTKGKKVQVKVSEFDREIVSKIRQRSGYDEQFFLKSFAPRENHKQMTKFQIGSGKSDSFFFYTANKQFIIKTLKDDELKLLVRQGILDKYYRHIKNNSQSLLARFYGIFTVKIKFMKPISVVIMDNLMGQQVEQTLRIYDLKGSLHRRESKKIDGNRTVRKDLNFLKETDIIMRLPPSVKSEFKRNMYKDKEFLKSCNLMDYSLLLIVFEKKEYNDEESLGAFVNVKQNVTSRSLSPQKLMKKQLSLDPSNYQQDRLTPPPESYFKRHSCESNPELIPRVMYDSREFGHADQDVNPLLNNNNPLLALELYRIDEDHKSGEESFNLNDSPHLEPRVNEFIQAQCYGDDSVYYRFGVIDFLQAYTRKKKLETMLLRKRFAKKPPNCFSCVEPLTYGDRFYEFLLTNLFTQQRFFPECELEGSEYSSKEGSPESLKKHKKFIFF